MPEPRRIEPGTPQGPVRVGVIVSRYNEWITDRLRDGALEALGRILPDAEATVIPAPGAFELPALARAAIDADRFDAVVCLGCLIRSETEHDRHIARAVAHALADLSTGAGRGPAVPIAFGVITANTHEQAEARAGGDHGNKGAEAMEAAIHSLGVIRSLRAASAEARP